MAHKYKLIYTTEPVPDGITKAQLDARPDHAKLGACDAILLCSLLYPEDGTFSVYFVGADGRKTDGIGELDDDEWFKVWTMLAHRLAASKTLPQGKREFAADVFETYRKALMAARQAEDVPKFD